MSLFASLDMPSTKSIIPETATFESKLIHHEERSKSSPDNIPNRNNTLVYTTEEGNDTFNFKEDTSQPYMLDLVESMRK